MAIQVKAKPKYNSQTRLSAMSEMTGDAVAKARAVGLESIAQVFAIMQDGQCQRVLTDGTMVIDLALLGIDQETSNIIEVAVLNSGVSRPAGLVALIGDATGSDPVITKANEDTANQPGPVKRGWNWVVKAATGKY